jgi:hypothetical protein
MLVPIGMAFAHKNKINPLLMSLPVIIPSFHPEDSRAGL